MANDYEIVPEKEFDSLRNDVEKIKRNPIGTSVEGKELKDSIDKLNNSINTLLNLFKNTAENLKVEEQENQVISTKIVPLFDKVQRLEEQNEKIAKGIVALAEMFDDLKSQKTSPSIPLPEMKRDEHSRNPYEFPQSQLPPKPTISDMNSQHQNNMQQPVGFGNDFNNPFGTPSFGPQPLPRMDMPSPPQMPPKKKSLFGR